MRKPARLLGAWIIVWGTASCTAGADFDDWYPPDITPPAGTQYQCALTALPRELPGIPAADRRFINHAYAMILKATQAKLVLLKALDGKADGRDLERYREAVSDARRRIAEEPAPAGLEAFATDVTTALDQQESFFVAALETRRNGGTMAQAYQHPDGRRASQNLFAAWAQMQKRYPSWPAETRESVYHHLCALDLF